MDGETRTADSLPLLLDARQVAQLLAVSERLVWRLRQDGLLPPPVRVGGTTRWPRQVIVNWVRAGCDTAGTRTAG